MPKRSTCSLLAWMLVVMTLAAPKLHASQSRSLIADKVDETKLVKLAGSTRREANAKNDRGPVAPNFQLHHMQLVLRRPPETEQALDRFIEEQNDPKFSELSSLAECARIRRAVRPRCRRHSNY